MSRPCRSLLLGAHNAAALLMFQSARIKDLEACIELSEDIDAIYDILPKPSTI